MTDQELESGHFTDSVLEDGNDKSDVTYKTFTLEEGIEKLGWGRLQWQLTFMCGLWWAADAMEIMLISFLLPELRDEWGLERNGLRAPKLEIHPFRRFRQLLTVVLTFHMHYSWQEGIVGSVTFLGIFLGAFVWGVIADRFGRKIGYLVTALFTSVLGFASAAAGNLLTMCILRGLLGFGIGGAPVAFSMYTEFLPAKNRGIVLVCFEGFWTFGILLEAGLAWAVLPTLGWRWLLGLTAVPLFILLFFYPFMYESPRYLLTSGNIAGAMQVLQQAAKVNKTELPEGVLQAIGRNEERGKFKDLLKPSLRRLSLLTWVIWFGSSIVYYGVILFTPGVFERTTGADPNEYLGVYTFVFVTSMAEIPGLIAASLLVDRIGRKKTLTLFFFLCGISLFPLAVITDAVVNLILIMSARMWIEGSFAVIWTYTPEAYPTSIRATGLGVANSVAKSASIFTPFISTYLLDISILIPVLVFGFMSIIAAVCSHFLPRETYQKKLDEEEETFELDVLQPNEEQIQGRDDDNTNTVGEPTQVDRI